MRVVYAYIEALIVYPAFIRTTSTSSPDPSTEVHTVLHFVLPLKDWFGNDREVSSRNNNFIRCGHPLSHSLVVDSS